MIKNNSRIFKFDLKQIKKVINISTLKNTIFFSGGIILFILGVIVYGVVLNLRDVPLEVAMKEKGFTELDNTNILVERKTYTLNLYEDSVLIKSYRASFGKNVSTPKNKAGDLSTPVGRYQICDIDTTSKYYIFLKLNYPNINDAAEALRMGVILQKTYDNLSYEFYYKGCPNPNTVLGGNIGIHGIGEYNEIFKNLPFVYNWTDGSIAVSNENIKEIYSVIKKGTEVVIK